MELLAPTEVLDRCRARFAQLEADLERQTDAAGRRRIKEAMRGVYRNAEYAAMKLVAVECRSSRQVADGKFQHLPAITEEVARLGLWLPDLVTFTDDEIEAGVQHVDDDDVLPTEEADDDD